jgi:hypothetical protein
MTKQNLSLSEIDLNKSFQTLIEHPYTAIQLVDKEKFHTGLFGFTCKTIPGFFFKLIDPDQSFQPTQLKIIFEHNSVDLTIKNEDEEIAVFEMKLKTTLHKKGKKDISQLEDIANKHPKPTKLFLVTLFDTKFDPNVDPEKRWRNITYKEIAELLAETLDKLLLGATEGNEQRHYTLISLWLEYLNELVKISDCVSNAGLEAIDFENLETSLDKIKLKGIFEDYRANQVLNLLSIWEIKAKIGFTLKTDNSHGNGLLDVAIIKSGYRFGLQWQGIGLKLFAQVESDDKSLEQKDVKTPKQRDEFLKKLGEYLQNKYDSNITVKLNKEKKEVKFRSITIKKDWSFFSDLNKSFDEILKIMNIISNFDSKSY